jgi:hypothetical protein
MAVKTKQLRPSQKETEMAYHYRVQNQESDYFLTLTRPSVGRCITTELMQTSSLKALNTANGSSRPTVSTCWQEVKPAKGCPTSCAISRNTQPSKSWLLRLFKEEKGFVFWSPDNHAEEIFSRRFLEQKLNYIHQNPVRAGYVHAAEDWAWSSAGSKVLELASWWD